MSLRWRGERVCLRLNSSLILHGLRVRCWLNLLHVHLRLRLYVRMLLRLSLSLHLSLSLRLSVSLCLSVSLGLSLRSCVVLSLSLSLRRCLTLPLRLGCCHRRLGLRLACLTL